MKRLLGRHLLGRRPAINGALPLAALVVVAVAGGVAVLGTVASATAGPALSVDATADTQPISPYIYGMVGSGLSEQLAAEMRISIERWGGDATTRYNWQANATNSGLDYYFLGGGGGAAAGTTDALEAQAIQSGGTTLLTIPIIPWISAPKPVECSFPTPPYPPQNSYSWSHDLPDGAFCGDDSNAETISGNFVDTDIASDDVANSPAFESGWVSHNVSTFGSAADGGVGVYEMDNEPGGWSNTHRDVHPALTGWNELVDDTEAYASVIKTADPTAQIDGPGDFAYWDSQGPQGDNAAAHPGFSNLAEYYLDQIGLYQNSAAWTSTHPGEKVIDYFDEHFYPSGGCIGLCAAGDAANQQARLDSTCELWQSSCSVDGTTEDIGLIPLMKSWIAEYDPGIPPAISEYNFGAPESINGALTEADVLGIFGSQGLGLASMWDPPTETDGVPQPVVFAFLMYRNYDGYGDGFGDTSVKATSADTTQLAVYGAKRSSDGALTVMVINKTANDLTSPLAISDFEGASSAQVYTYDATNLDAIVPGSPVPVSGGTINYTFPASSISLFVLPPASEADATVPGAPQVTGVTTGNGQATVSFTPPGSDGGAPITSYTVTADDAATPADGGELSYGTKSPIVIGGLTDGQSYTFTVTASNLAGPSSGASSQASSLPTTTTTPPGPPGTSPPIVTTTTIVLPSGPTPSGSTGAGSSPGGGSPGAEGTSTAAGTGTSTTTTTPPGGTAPGTGGSPGGGSAGRRSGGGSRAGGLVVSGVRPARIIAGAPLVWLQVHGGGFRRGARVSVSGGRLRMKSVRVVNSGLIVVEMRATRWAGAGRRNLTVMTGSRRATCRRCLDVAVARRVSHGSARRSGT